MLHKFEPAAAPRVFLLPGIVVLVIAGSILLIVLVQPLIGIIALAITAWMSYHIVKYTISQFKSFVETDEEQLACLTSLSVKTNMEWSSVTHRGAYKTAKGQRYLFVYDESEDELLTVPPYYTEVGKLEECIRSNGEEFLELTGDSPADLGPALRPFLKEDPPDATDEEDGEPGS